MHYYSICHAVCCHVSGVHRDSYSMGLAQAKLSGETEPKGYFRTIEEIYVTCLQRFSSFFAELTLRNIDTFTDTELDVSCYFM